MDKLEAMQVYVCVVDTHSFIRAAEVLGVPRSTVSRVVKELESWLKIQLLQRTTRKLSVTAEGRRYYEECKRVLADIAAMESSFPGRAAQPKGRFKVGMPQSLARHCIIPTLPAFLRQYPELELILCSSDSVEDIILQGYDCVIRAGRIDDSTTLVARPLASFNWVIAASPTYIERYGSPENLDDLQKHHAVGYLNHRTGRTTDWFFTREGKDYAMRVQETLVVDDTDAYIQAGMLMLAGCTTTYTMTTRTGEIIETQGKPEVDTATGMTKYADVYGYHRVIKTSEIVQTTEGASKLDW
ncbi:YgdI/YgdR family lipoprotein [Salmonella enterica]|nr:YgdI/YgdR family lipoprotein [Salmonella enterica]